MKLVVSVVLLAFVAFVAADNCDSLQRFKIKHQWSEAFGEGHHRLEFAVKLFKGLFHDYPELVESFAAVGGENIYSPQFEAYAERVLAQFDILVGLLDDQATLEAQVKHLASRVKDKDFKPEQFQKFGKEILDVLPEYLGTRLDYGAWTACLKNLKVALTAS